MSDINVLWYEVSGVLGAAELGYRVGMRKETAPKLCKAFQPCQNLTGNLLTFPWLPLSSSGVLCLPLSFPILVMTYFTVRAFSTVIFLPNTVG